MNAETADTSSADSRAILWRIPRFVGASILFGLVWLCPFPVGCQDQFWWAMLGMAGLSACGLFLVGSARHSRGIPAPLLLCVLLAIWMLVAFQLVPLPTSVVEFLSPKRASLGISSSQALGLPAPSSMTLSIASKETRDALLLFTLYAGGFICAMLVFRRPRRLRLLYTLLATSGAAMSAYGFLLFLTEGSVGRLQSTYTNANRLAALLGICMLAGVGWRLLADHSGKCHESKAATIAASLCGLGFVATVSRMGIASMSVGVLLLAFIALRQRESETQLQDARGRRLLVIGTSIALSALLVSLMASFDPVWQRYSVLFDAELAGGGRLTCWRQSLGIVNDFAAVGSGAGSYQHVFPIYQEAGSLTGFWKYTHNDYLNALADIGPVGLLLILAGVALWYRAAWRGLSSSSNAARVAAWVGIGSMTFVALHSVADFVLKQPANTFVLAVVLGATLGAGATQSRKWMSRRTHWVLIALGVVFLVAATSFIPLVRSAAVTPIADGSAELSGGKASNALALAADPRSNELRHRAARDAIRRGPDTSIPPRVQFEKALEILRSAPNGELIDARAVYLAGMLMYQLGDAEQSDEAAAFAVSIARAYPSITRAAGTYFIRRVIDTRGKHKTALQNAVDALRMSNMTSLDAGGVRQSLQMLEAVPGGVAHLSEVTPQVEWAVRLLAGQHARAMRFTKARRVVEEFRDSNETGLSPSMLVFLADLQDRGGDTPAALNSRIDYILGTTQSRRTSAAAGMVLKFIRERRPAEAAMLVRALRRRHPDEPAGLRAEAEFARHSNDLVAASRLLTKLAESSTNADDFYQLAMVAMKLRRYPKAELQLSRAIELRPRNSTYWRQRATVRELTGEMGLAIQDMQCAVDVSPRSDSLRIHLARLLLKTKRVDRLVEVWAEAYEDRPESALVNEQLARALHAAAEFERAIEHARKSYEINPKRKSIVTYLRQIDPDGPVADHGTP